MIWTGLTIAVPLLALERLTYWWAWNHPRHFEAAVRRLPGTHGVDPVNALRRLFMLFKLIQLGVLLGWCVAFGGAWTPLPTAPGWLIVGALMLLGFGQLLNFSVMARLGRDGVFYGNRFGRKIEWRTGFPFSIVPHPQYLGALLSVWAFMLIMRFPNPDWIALPLASTVLYAWGAWVERQP